MASIDASNVIRPVEQIRPGDLPGAGPSDLANALQVVVESTATDSSTFIHGPIPAVSKLSWVQQLIPGLEELAVDYFCGNYVIVRGETQPFFESMPLFARLGMDLLFYSRDRVRVLGGESIEELLREISTKQGKIYDNPESASTIPAFIKTYSIQTDELLNRDIGGYQCFNDFFSRKLRPDARPIQNEEDKTVVCSVSDSRLTVYPSLALAKEFWVKGRKFTISKLLNLPSSSPKLHKFQDASLAIFRLAPADYHRFHSPIDCVVRDVQDIPGEFYTVNPQAVGDPGFDVLTSNSRSVLHLAHLPTGLPVAIVAIGALLVGSINWTGGDAEGSHLKRGDELGFFAYGGSTIVAVFPKNLLTFDADLVENSEKPIETLVKVGYSIGRTIVGD